MCQLVNWMLIRVSIQTGLDWFKGSVFFEESRCFCLHLIEETFLERNLGFMQRQDHAAPEVVVHGVAEDMNNAEVTDNIKD